VRSAKVRIEEEFALERNAGLVDDVVVEGNLSVVAVVGAEMRERPGVAGRLFDVLGDRAINVRAIAQGSSELNISFVVARRDEARALNAIHEAFFADESPSVSIFVAGVGRVGSALVRQVGEGAAPMWRLSGASLRVAGTCTSKEMCVDGRLEPANLTAFAHAAIGAPGPVVFVDCTASDAVPAVYGDLLDAGIPIVSANKRPFSASMERFEALHAAADGGDAGLYFETTAGAGLPIVSTIRAFADSGDTIRSIEGVFSGTVAFLMSELRSGRGFSEGVRAAHVAGYTEPDPREDLSGADVARKLLILARVAGYRIEPDEVDVTPLLSDTALHALSLEDFWEALPTVDKGFADLDRDATKRGGTLCYLARFAGGQASVGLDVVDPSHPCAALHGTDNVFLVRSERYAETPLVIRGPGAGPDVTAAGVLADILTAVRETWPR